MVSAVPRMIFLRRWMELARSTAVGRLSSRYSRRESMCAMASCTVGREGGLVWSSMARPRIATIAIAGAPAFC